MSRVLGVDHGTKRVGLALSDTLGITASPWATVSRPDVVATVKNLVKEMDVGTIVVGLPTGLSGVEGTSASEARQLADELGSATGVEVVLVDERYTSRIAESSLLESGMKRRERREKIDQVAAALILQDYLDNLR
ncbi:MAG TPA: Holliday junction resolvase RuvX [Acidimicrobiia bacterium]|nr:Holliday junction resolvase RuvX [Acidimicrobiia bacterium]